MRRITKIGSVALALAVAIPGLFALDLFGPAEATPDAPLLYSTSSFDPITHVAYAETALESGLHVIAYTLDDGLGTLIVRDKPENGQVLYELSPNTGTWTFTGLQISRDGTSILAGALEGHVIYITSIDTLYDSFRIFDARSPVTDVTMDASGDWFAASTYHGDLYFFQGERLVDGGGFVFHHQAPMPVGTSPLNPDEYGNTLGNILESGDIPFFGESALTLRPYNHLAMAGKARSPDDPSGLAVAAASAYGTVYIFDVAAASGPAGAMQIQPHPHRVGDGECETFKIDGEEWELPCSEAAVKRIIQRLDSLTGGTAHPVFEAVGAVIGDTLKLDPILGLTPTLTEQGLIDLDATHGPGISGSHIVTALRGDGHLEAIRVQTNAGTSSGANQLAGQGGPVGTIWEHTPTADPVGIALSTFHETEQGAAATLAYANQAGDLITYNITLTGPFVPEPDLQYSARVGDLPVGIARLDIARGAGDGPLSPGAGRYVLLATEDRGLHLLDTQKRTGQGEPNVHWRGTFPFFDTPTGVDLIDSGGVLTSASGLALYAAQMNVALSGADSVNKLEEYTAHAVVDAPDAPAVAFDWKVEALDSPLPDRNYATRDLSHTFTAEGTYRVTVKVTDSLGRSDSATKLVDVGGRRPVVTYTAPPSVPLGNPITFDFNGTHDPDGDFPGGAGLDRIEFYPYANDTMVLVDLDTLTVDFTYQGEPGLYRTTATAVDHDGRKGEGRLEVKVTGAGFQVPEDPPAEPEDDPVRLNEMAVAEETGHTVTYGGDGAEAGRWQVRSPDASIVYAEGNSTAGGIESDIVSAAVNKNATVFYAGLRDGRGLRIPIHDPASRTFIDVFDEPLAWTFASEDGARVVWITESGKFAGVEGDLYSIVNTFDMEETIVRVIADDTLRNMIVETEEGHIVVLNGLNLQIGEQDRMIPEVVTTALEVTPNLDRSGRVWLFVGREDGRLQTIKIQGHRLQVLGDAPYDSIEHSVVSIDAAPIDDRSHYKLAAVTRTNNAACANGNCGKLVLIDSRGPREGGVPVPQKSVEVPNPPRTVHMTDDGRQFLVMTEGVNERMYRYDSILDAPVGTIDGLPARVLSTGMAETGAGYLLLANGQVAWAFAPPRAAFDIGPHNETGQPEWGARVTAKRDTTFDSGPTREGDGRISSYRWSFGDGATDSSPVAVHEFARTGTHTVRLTVISTITSPVKATLTDRVEVPVPVWNPPPVAILHASPFNTSASAVTIETGQRVTFDASDSFDRAGGSILNYRFQWGDGQALRTGDSIRAHVYGQSGVFRASVTVYDNDGFGTRSDTIKVIVENRLPTARLTWSQPDRNETSGTLTQNVPVYFDGTQASDPDGHVAQWEWTFSGGIILSGSQVEHRFASLGTQTAQLRVQDDDGAWSEPLVVDFTIDDGIRLRQTQDPPSGHTINPTATVTAYGHVHDFSAYPGQGAAVPGATVRVDVFYDGALGSQPSNQPYHSETKTTDGDGDLQITVPYNSAGLAYEPGQYRIQMTARQTGSFGGDTEWSRTTETVFIVEP